METSQQIVKAGDVNIEAVQITTVQGVYQDITNQVMAIQIFEDMFSPFTSGTLEVRDSLDLLNVLPLNGEEFLHLKISTPTLDKDNIDHKFYIFKMSNRVMAGDRSTIYTLHFISVEALTDLNTKISKTFSGKCSDIIKMILDDKTRGLNVTKPYTIEETKNSTKYISNFWPPVKNINNVIETSINMNNQSSYVFYENRTGFNFVSLDSLYVTNIFQTFVYDVYIRDEPSNTLKTTRNVTEDYKRIREINVPTEFDYIERVRGGMFGSKMYTHDLSSKRISLNAYNMLDNFASQKHLNKFPLASNKVSYSYDELIMTVPKYHNNFSDFGDSTNANSIQNRASLMAQINGNKLQIVVPGRFDYTVGLRVELKLYKIEPNSKTDTQILDGMLSGTYLISAINHYVSRTMHECTFELIKESLLIDLDRKQ